MNYTPKYFVLHIDLLQAVKHCSDEDAGKLLKAFIEYHEGAEPTLDGVPRALFLTMKGVFDRSMEKMKETSVKRSESGKKGGKANDSKSKQMKANANNSKQDEANADNSGIYVEVEEEVYVEVKENEKVEEEGLPEKKQPNKFVPPTEDEAFVYMNEYITAKMMGWPEYFVRKTSEKFCNFYQMKGWKVGKDAMKDWKAAVRNWVLSTNFNPLESPPPVPVTPKYVPFTKPEDNVF